MPDSRFSSLLEMAVTLLAGAAEAVMERRDFDRATDQRPPIWFLLVVVLIIVTITALAILAVASH